MLSLEEADTQMAATSIVKPVIHSGNDLDQSDIGLCTGTEASHHAYDATPQGLMLRREMSQLDGDFTLFCII